MAKKPQVIAEEPPAASAEPEPTAASAEPEPPRHGSGVLLSDVHRFSNAGYNALVAEHGNAPNWAANVHGRRLARAEQLDGEVELTLGGSLGEG